jgi:hypothetical protein
LINNIFKAKKWVNKNKTFDENQTIFNRLVNERNWISESTKIKKMSKAVNFVKKLRSDENIIRFKNR